MSGLIVVVGMSGVGKTTVCKAFAERNPAVDYISASEVLRGETGLSGEQLARLPAREILSNQDVLVAALKNRPSKPSTKLQLLDAQILVDNGEDLVELSVESFAKVAPESFVLLEANPIEVKKRREGDTRWRPSRTVRELDQQAERIRLLARNYARALNVPLFVGQVSGAFKLEDVLQI